MFLKHQQVNWVMMVIQALVYLAFSWVPHSPYSSRSCSSSLLMIFPKALFKKMTRELFDIWKEKMGQPWSKPSQGRKTTLWGSPWKCRFHGTPSARGVRDLLTTASTPAQATHSDKARFQRLITGSGARAMLRKWGKGCRSDFLDFI